MRLRSVFSLLALSLALGPTSNLLGDGPTFTTIDFPGATSTQPYGINTRGDVVGFYTLADTSSHGFLLSGGQFTPIDFPGALYTVVWGINSSGDFVGDYASTLSGSGPHHGFLRSNDGAFTTIDFPDATTTAAGGITPRGDIVGGYMSADNVNHNFLLSAGQYSTIDYPGATVTLVNGINPQGDIVGGYNNPPHGFLLSDGDLTGQSLLIFVMGRVCGFR